MQQGTESPLSVLRHQSHTLETQPQIIILMTPTPILIRKSVDPLKLLVSNQDDSPKTFLKRIPDALAGLRRINQLRFISIPDQHRRQIRPAKVGPDRQEIDIVKTDVINAVAQQLEPDVLDEAAIERKPERLLHNGQRHRDVLVDLIPREVGRHMRKKLCQMLRAI